NQLKEKTSSASGPRGAQSHLTKRIKPAPRHWRENQLKEKTSSASGPRGAQSHLTERIKSAPRRRAQPPRHFTSSPKINGGTKSALVA
ncbi:MAG: hypothetical protein ACLR29_10645, partial [Faecalibacterium prausnitzii]